MYTKNATTWVLEKIDSRKMPIKKISEETKIAEHKLVLGTARKLNATEFLVLCAYLEIRPEEYYKDIKRKDDVKHDNLSVQKR